jgi:hypothetical protein
MVNGGQIRIKLDRTEDTTTSKSPSKQEWDKKTEIIFFKILR